MADPLSVAGSIAGLISIGDIVFRKLYHYVKTVKKAEQEIVGLKNEVAALTGVLHNLRLIAQDLEADDRFDNTVQVEHVESCLNTLYKINQKLSKIDTRHTLQRLKWPFKSTDTRELTENVRKHRETLSLALSADTMAGLLQCLSSQKDIISHLDSIRTNLRKRDEIDMRIAMNTHRKQIIKSFLTIDVRKYYELSVELRHPTTGFWLTRDDTFQRWLNRTGSSLWLTGIPGAGKTTLSGLIIQQCCKSTVDDAVVAYFYCDYRDGPSQSIVHMLSCLAGQIGMKNESCFALLEDYYDVLRPQDQMERPPKTEELIALIHAMASVVRDVRIVVDGLDECGEETADAAEMLNDLVCTSQGTISLALLSRNIPEIHEVFEDSEHIEITAHTEDVEHYVRSEIEGKRRRLHKRSNDLKEEIVQKLTTGAQGMFRWVACQLDHLAELHTDADRRRALDQLPSTLNETYERILLRIKPHNIPLARMTLAWLARGSPKLKTEALLEALAIQAESDQLDPDARPSVEDVLHCCSSLVRRSGAYLELAHFTVQEYLKTIPKDTDALSQFRIDDSAQVLLAQACLRYLCFPIFNRPVAATFKEMLAFRDKFPFHAHASTAWIGYIRDHWERPEVCELSHRLFAPQGSRNFSIWVVQFVLFNELDNIDYNVDDDYEDILGILSAGTIGPLHFAAICGLLPICRWLLQQGCDIDQLSPRGSPLSCCYQTINKASYIRQEDVAAVAVYLIRTGARYDDLPEGALSQLIGIYITSNPTLEHDPDILNLAGALVQRTESTITRPADTRHPSTIEELILLDRCDQVKKLYKDGKLDLHMRISGKSLLQLASDAGSVKSLQFLLNVETSVTGDQLRLLLHGSVVNGRQAATRVLVTFAQEIGIGLPRVDLVYNCIARGFIDVLICLEEHEPHQTSLFDEQRLVGSFVTHLTNSKVYEWLSRFPEKNSQKDSSERTALHTVLDGSRVTNLWTGKDDQLHPDVVTGAMMDHLIQPDVIEVMDCKGKSIWSRFCTSYLPRLVASDNAFALSTLEAFTQRLLTSKKAGRYNEPELTHTEFVLLVQSALDAHEQAEQNDHGERPLAQMFSVALKSGVVSTFAKARELADLLVWSIRASEDELFKVLLNLGADVHMPSIRYDEESALFLCGRGRGHVWMFKEVMKHIQPSRLQEVDVDGDTLLHCVCAAKDSTTRKVLRLETLLEAGIDIHVVIAEKNLNALHLTGIYGFTEGMRILLNHGADIYSRDLEGWGVVAHAISKGKANILKELESLYPDDKMWRWKYQTSSEDLDPPMQGCSGYHLAVMADGAEMLEYMHKSQSFGDFNESADNGYTPLHLAVMENANASIRWLIDNNANVNALTHKHGATALHFAVREGQVDTVALLIKAGAKLMRDAYGRFPDASLARRAEDRYKIHKLLSGSKGDHSILQTLITGSSALSSGEQLIRAIRGRDMRTAKAVLNEEPHLASFTSQRCKTCTPLIVALSNEYEPMVKLLLDTGASTGGRLCTYHNDRYTRDLVGLSAVNIAAATASCNELLPTILDASLSQPQHWSWLEVNPFHVAAVLNPQAIGILDEHVAAHAELFQHFNKHQKTRYISTIHFPGQLSWPPGNTPLHLAAREDEKQPVISLLDIGAAIDEPNESGQTALHQAARRRSAAIVALLLERGANPNALNEEFRTPLHVSAETGTLEAAKILLAYGSDINAVDDTNKTALHIAALETNLDMFIFLIERGCNPYWQDTDGRCAITIALLDPQLATYVYMSGLDLTQVDFINHVLEYSSESSTKRLLRCIPQHVLADRVANNMAKAEHLLFKAAYWGDVNLLNKLIEAGVSPQACRPHYPQLPMIAACLAGEYKTAEALVRHGATISLVSKTSNVSALHFPDFARWFFVEWCTKRRRISSHAAQAEDPELKNWSGVHRLVIPLDRPDDMNGSSVSWARQMYLNKPHWQRFVPLHWKLGSGSASPAGAAEAASDTGDEEWEDIEVW